MKIRDRIKELRRVKASELHPNPKNWRTHPKQQLDALRGILAEVGFAGAELARELPDGSLQLIDGHARAEIAGDAEIPVLILDVTESEADKILATFDPLGAMAEANTDKLEELLRDVQTGSEALAEMLAELAEDNGILDSLGDAEIVEDEVPEPPAEPITKPGDLWLLGEHRLLCGDSTNAEDVKRLMSGAKANLCFTSPPYADMRKYSGNDLCVEKLATIFESFGSHCELYLVNLGMQFKNDEVYPYWNTWIEIAKQSGLNLLSWLIWDRINATSVSSQKKMFAVTHEWIFVFGKKTFEINRTWEKSEESKKREIYYRTNSAGQKVTTRRQKDGSVKESVIGEVFSNKNMGTVFTCYAEMRRDLDHPARFPIEFPSAYIESLTNDGDLVCEPFLGSGTTLIAAEQLGRKCYGMEISPAYCDVIVKRWETLTGKKAVLENGHS